MNMEVITVSTIGMVLSYRMSKIIYILSRNGTIGLALATKLDERIKITKRNRNVIARLYNSKIII